MEKPPSFQWYPKDCDTDENVRMMDDAEYGFYGRCLNHAWINDGLPGNLNDVARVLGRPIAKVKKYWLRVGKCFVLIEDRYRNMKQEGQRKSAREFQESRRNAANSRWINKDDMHVHSTCIEDALHVQCSASASPTATASAELKPLVSAEAESPKPRKATASIGTRIEVEKLPDEWAQFALTDCGMDLIASTREFAVFRDYWAQQPGVKGRKADWFATWRNWARRCNDRAGPNQKNSLFPKKLSYVESVEKVMHERMLEGRPPL